MQTISADDVEKRRNELAKMRSLMYKHESKQKHMAKIKSKDYHRRQKKSARLQVGCTPTKVLTISSRGHDKTEPDNSDMCLAHHSYSCIRIVSSHHSQPAVQQQKLNRRSIVLPAVVVIHPVTLG